MEKNTMTKLGDAYAEVQEATAKQRALAGIKAKPKGQVTLPKAPWDKKKEGVEEDASNDTSDDGAGLDKADPKAAKKKFKDRKDKDIDNDGDVDSSDEYLHKRRKAISKNVKEADDKTTPCPKCDGSMENHAKDCPNHPDTKGKDDTAVMNPKNDEKEKVATTESVNEGILNKKTYNKKSSWLKAYAELKKMKKDVPANKMQDYKNLLNQFFQTTDDFNPSNMDKWNTKTSKKNNLGDDPVADLRFELKDVLGKDAGKIMEMTEPKWPVYKRIMEKVAADKAKKDAEKGEEMDSKDSEGAKKFVDDHEKNDEKKQGDKADIAVAIKKNAAAMANPMKAAPLRPGDNKAGDKVADKPEGKM